MYVVIFEFIVKSESKNRYFELAAEVREELEKQDGFIAIERYESLQEENKILSVSSWESEEAIVAWRSNVLHRQAQQEGKDAIFVSYRLRVAEVIRDYGHSNH